MQILILVVVVHWVAKKVHTLSGSTRRSSFMGFNEKFAYIAAKYYVYLTEEFGRKRPGIYPRNPVLRNAARQTDGSEPSVTEH